MVHGTLKIKFINGKDVYLENVENFNLINGCYYIWVTGKHCINYFQENVIEFFYSYTKY